MKAYDGTKTKHVECIADTKSEIVKILHFKQFYKHYIFVEDGRWTKKS